MAAAAATGVDYGKDLAEKQILERLAPRIAERLAVKLGQETAEKWVGRLIPLASSVIGGALNYAFVRAWGARVQRNLRLRHIARHVPVAAAHAASSSAYTPARPLTRLAVAATWQQCRRPSSHAGQFLPFGLCRAAMAKLR